MSERVGDGGVAHLPNLSARIAEKGRIDGASRRPNSGENAEFA
ncbi:hypothetical protein AKJ09_11467 [Labilithrix luteola]|uniref:Uncharacterized protein n=1 Tax=Labilithrix luteola TaxID=1391654 RepID=A0A0K1QGB4_9BACT|nr:hypothetical protein AKJ09_11467 [Labilithrix luteola]